jgi:glycosyltransferase involved in cell wall biosynthesis/GT2 family glycosyltransferase
MSTVWLEKDELMPTALRTIEGVDTVLDVGCGIRPQEYIIPAVHICCDPCQQYIEHLQKKVAGERDRQYVIIKADWSSVIDIFPSESVDTVFLLDVIEHVEKEEGKKLLRATEAIARRQVVVFTPLGFFPQYSPDGKDAWGLDGGKWQEHKSGWRPEDFDDSWDIYAAEVFHTQDHTEKKYESPCGAFWAVKNIKGYTPALIPAPKESVLRESTYKAKRARLFYCKLGIRRTEDKDGTYHLHFVFGDNRRKWENSKIAPQTKEFKEFLVVSPDTKQELLITPKDVYQGLKQDYDFAAAHSAFCQNRISRISRPAVAFTVRDSSVIGGGTATVFNYANWLYDLGVDVAIYSDDEPPGWINVKGKFHYIKDCQKRYSAIKEPVVIVYSIRELQDLLFFGNVKEKVIYHLCQGIEEYHFGGLDYSALMASKPMFGFLFSLPVGRIAVSPHIRDYFENNYSQKTHNIFNGIDIDFFRPRPKRTLNETINILSSGNPLHSFKGKTDIREALNIIAQIRPNVEFSFAIACGQELNEKCSSWVGSNFEVTLKLGLSPEQMRQAYYNSDIYINSSWYEGFGLPPLEAMACGVPVIQADNQGLTGIVADRKNCLLIPPNDPEKMAQAIVTLIGDDALRNNLIKNGFETVGRFTKLNQYEMFIEEFERILNCKFDGALVEAEKHRLQSGFNRSYSKPAHGQIQPQNPESIDLADRNVEISAETARTTQLQESRPPFFSVLIPAYNQAGYLPTALDSLINQTSDNWEAIVVNDGSTDETSEVMASYAARDKRIRTFHKENGGVASALNHGLQNARGRWICWLSSDDFFEPDKLKIHLQAIEESPAIKFFHTHYFALLEEKGVKIPVELDLDTFIPPVELQVLKFFDINYFNGISIVIHREVFDHVGLFDEQYANGQDFDMWLRISARYRSLFINRRTCVTRLHAKQDSNRFPPAGKLDSARSCLDFLNKHSFAEIFPVLDLLKPEHALFAIRSTLKVLANPVAFINLCGYGPALMDRLREWLVQSAPVKLRSQLKPELAKLADIVQRTNLSEEIKAAFRSIGVSIERPFQYRAYDPVMEVARHVTRLEKGGRAEEAIILKRYIDRVSPRIGDLSNVISEPVLTD